MCTWAALDIGLFLYKVFPPTKAYCLWANVVFLVQLQRVNPIEGNKASVEYLIGSFLVTNSLCNYLFCPNNFRRQIVSLAVELQKDGRGK